MNTPHIVRVDFDWLRMETFMRTGHPRTIGIAIKKTPNKDGLFKGVEITKLTVAGRALE